MSRAEILYGVHIAIGRLEWINKHVSARPANDVTMRQLVREIGDLNAWLELLLEEFAPPPPR